MLSPLPLFHSYALNLSVLGVLATGASEYIMEKFSVSEAVRLLKTGEFTVFPGVPTMFHYLLQATREAPGAKFPNLRLCISAGAIMPATLKSRNSRSVSACRCSTATASPRLHDGDDELADRRTVLGSCGFSGCLGFSVRIVDAGACARCRARRGGRTDRTRAERDAWLSQQAGGNREGVAQRLVSHRRSCSERCRTAFSPSRDA